jgi:FixJ family two-component response regulator
VPDTATVFVVDDDEQARNSTRALVTHRGLNCELSTSAEEFLAAYQSGQPGCLVTELGLIGMDGLALIRQMHRRDIYLPAIVVTAFARTSITVEAMRIGAFAMFDKPYRDDELWNAIQMGLHEYRSRDSRYRRRLELLQRLSSLSPSQRMVLDRVVAGKANKVIAAELDVSLRTVENRRREVLTTMQADSVAELVRMVIEAELPTVCGNDDRLASHMGS